jgi:hypothetical protein
MFRSLAGEEGPQKLAGMGFNGPGDLLGSAGGHDAPALSTSLGA